MQAAREDAMSATAAAASAATMRVKRIAHDESQGSNPNQNGTAFHAGICGGQECSAVQVFPHVPRVPHVGG